MSETKRTAQPWGIEWTSTTAWIGPMRRNGDRKIATVVCSIDREGLTDMALAQNDADAKFIVLAVNCHDELVEALELAIQGLLKLKAMTGHESDQLNLDQARAALAKATGGQT